jgi:3-polyprenyl-4-hydroxybenzoate decarboxylase
VPPMPAFYLRPKTVEDVVEALVPRVLSALGIPEALDEPVAYQAQS